MQTGVCVLRQREGVAVPIFHLSVRTLSRSAGRSAVVAAAYRAGARLRCERTGRVYDYTRRHGVVATRVVVPQSETTISRQQLWDRAEAAEKRCNSTVAREIELALPCELDAAARESLALGFAADIAARYRIVVDVAIHEPSGKTDSRNHHVHLLTSTRVWEAGCFGEKVRRLDDRRTGPAEITAMRESWSTLCNAALAAAGMAATVDHRSHRERGLTDEPGQKLGPAAVGVERRTGTVSRRRSEQDAERATHEHDAASMRGAAENTDARKQGPDRLQLHSQVLRRLRLKFAAATAAAMARRPHQALERDPLLTPPRPRQVTAAAGRQPSTGPARSAPWSTPQVAVTPRIPAPQAGKRKRHAYDETAEAAAMYRRVERELDAEHEAQIAEAQAGARLASASVGHGRSSGAIAIGLARVPALSGTAPRRRAGAVATDPMRRLTVDEGFDRPTGDRHDVGSAAEVAGVHAPGPTANHGPEPRNLAVMAAQELARRHKRSRARLSRLAAAAGMNDAAFAAEIAAREETAFDPALLATEPALAALWEAWMGEDRAKQRDRTDAADDRAPAVVAEAVPSGDAMPPIDMPVEREPDPARPAITEAGADSDAVAAASPQNPYRRRDAVVDFAITVIARGGWSPEVGNAIAGLLETRPGWMWREAHRVCRARHGADRPQSLTPDVIGTIRRRSRAEAARHGQMGRTMDAIDRGWNRRGIV